VCLRWLPILRLYLDMSAQDVRKSSTTSTVTPKRRSTSAGRTTSPRKEVSSVSQTHTATDVGTATILLPELQNLDVGCVIFVKPEWIIYEIRKKLTDCLYIGRTAGANLLVRLNQHRRALTPLGNALRKYGVQLFTCREIFRTDDFVECVRYEAEIIDRFRDHYQLYNIRSENPNRRVLTLRTAEQRKNLSWGTMEQAGWKYWEIRLIKYRLSKTWSCERIAAFFGRNPSIISRMLRGKTWAWV